MYTIDDLKMKLELSDLPDNGDYSEYFSDIAKMLMNHFIIKKGDKSYEIVETEFYLFTPKHPDVITYPRDANAGEWFFHQSGVDITFKSEKNDREKFGGILIRGIRNLTNPSEIIWGPQRCVNELWNKFDIFGHKPEEYPHIVERPSNAVERPFGYEKLYKAKRWIPINSNKVKSLGSIENVKIEKIKSLIKNRRIDEKLAKDIVYESSYRYVKRDISSVPKSKYGAAISSEELGKLLTV